jgi:hypothetical protein
MKSKIYYLLNTLIILTAIIGVARIAMADDSLGLAGTYSVRLETQGNAFEDSLVIERAGDFDRSLLEFSGTYTVPGAFVAPAVGSVRFTYDAAGFPMEFDIIADENGNRYKVHYFGVVSHYGQGAHHQFKGVALLADGSFLGTFTALQLTSAGSGP